MAATVLRTVTSPRKSYRPVPRPFLKWAGGKGQLLPHLVERVTEAGSFRRYHEPFVGGGALYFELTRLKALDTTAYLSDVNPNLIDAYIAVRDDVDVLVRILKKHQRSHSEEYYYRMRARAPRSVVHRGARIIYLNKTCYNGLYRENSKGLFNVPYGRYKDPLICDEENLRAVSAVLKKARFDARSFETVLRRAKPNDFVYFDPPYHPISKTSDFTSYAKNGFGSDAQHRLAMTFKKLSAKGVKVLLSNSMSEFILELYRDYRIDQVLASRLVNSKAERRGKIAEALISNF